MLHLKAVARTRAQRYGDYALVVFGFAATIYTSIGTIKVRVRYFDGTFHSFIITDLLVLSLVDAGAQ